MTRDEGDWDEPDSLPDSEPVIDFAIDLVDTRDEDDVSSDESDISPEWSPPAEMAVLDNIIAEFVELINARDLEALEDLVAEDVEADFLKEFSSDGFLAGWNDLLLRHPDLLLTRGDLGVEPIAAMWRFDQQTDHYGAVGYLSFELSDLDESCIQRVAFVDELPDSDDLVIERPEDSEFPEWDDWSALDED